MYMYVYGIPSVLLCLQCFDAVGWAAGRASSQVICLERGADFDMAQLMPLPLTVSCFSKIQMVLSSWYRLTRVVPDKGPLNGCVCIYVCMWSRWIG